MARAKELTPWAACAKAIRAELKAKFPKTTFRVRSSAYANGCSVKAYWTNGPTRKAVEAVINKYQGGSFDGMTDMYTYDGGVLTCDEAGAIETLPSAKYIFADRSFIGPDGEDDWELRGRIARDLAEFYAEDFTGDLNAWIPNSGQQRWTDAVYRLLEVADLTGGYHGVRRAPEDGSAALEVF